MKINNLKKNQKLSGKNKERFNRAARFHQQGKFIEAKELYNKILQKHPKHADSLHLLGLITADQGDVATGLQLVTNAITANPKAVFFYLNRGMMYERIGNLTAACKDVQKSIQLDVNQWNSHAKLGELYQAREQHGQAIASFLTAIKLNPNNRNSHHNLGKSYLALEQYEDAAQACRAALAIDPNCVETLSNYGVILCSQKQPQQAIECYQKAVVVNPNYAYTYINWGMALIELNQLDEAEQKLNRAIELEPQKAEFHSSLGNLYKERGDLTKALACFNHALSLDPNATPIRFNLAITQLQLGDFQHGLENYEVRFGLAERQKFEYHFSQPVWRGEPLTGKTLFISIEQGLGDTIQFLRYIPMLEQFGGNIIMECQRELIPLVEQQQHNITIIPRFNSPSHFDYHIPIMSLALVFKTDLSTIPFPEGYLAVPEKPELSNFIKPTGLNVGIVWAGGTFHKNNTNRSIALEKYKPLFETEEINFYSLQVGDRIDDIAECNLQQKIMNLAPYIKDFSDTAAVLSKLDLLITVDTAIAHLGGALATPTWILLPFASDFRWLQNCNDCKWYDAVRLFRQHKRCDWSNPIKEVQKTLCSLRKK